MRHTNIHGECGSCEGLFDRYPGFHSGLRLWFRDVRRTHFDAHICWAGRGAIDQQTFFHRGSSDAQWTQSAHNWNAAIDVWFLDPTKIGSYNGERSKYLAVLATNPLVDDFDWYGAQGSHYPEVGHFQVHNWRDLATTGALKLVEQ